MTWLSYRLPVIFLTALLLQGALWFHFRDVRARWLNVPPVISDVSAGVSGLGDSQLSYRFYGVMLQNMGDTGGQTTALSFYDYEKLSGWFFLMDRLDPYGTFMPFLASFYYGGVDDPNRLRHVTTYLATIGQRPGDERWRWLARAVYLARFKIKDLPWAYDLSLKLAALPEEGQPLWTRQMPAFIKNAQGNKKESLAIMLEILKSSANTAHPNEINHTMDYICMRILEGKERSLYDFCDNVP